jgi:hypothetical protein
VPVKTTADIEISQAKTDAGYVCPHCGKTEHIPNAIAWGEISGAIIMDPAQYRTRKELKTALQQVLQN